MRKGESKTGVYIQINEVEAVIGVDSPTRIMGQIFYCFIKRLNYYSIDGVKDVILGAADVAEGFLQYKKSSLLQRQIMGVRAMVKRTEDKDDLIRFIFDQILVSECLATLPGFGFVAMEKNEEGRRRIKGNFLINPEKTSIYKV